MNEQQYERIARWLDGETIELTPAEQAVAQEIRGDEAAIAETMTDVQTPLAAMARARRRMTAAAGGAGQRVIRLAFGAMGAAAAAAVVLAVSLVWTQPKPLVAPGATNHDIPAEVWIGAMTPSTQMEAIAALSDSIDRLASEVATSKSALPVDHEIESIQDELNDFWQEDPQAWASEG